MVETHVPETAEEVARSLHRLWGRGLAIALGADDAAPEWDKAGLDEQLGWFLVARKGPKVLEQSVGVSMREAGLRLSAVHGHPEKLALALDPEQPMGWEPEQAWDAVLGRRALAQEEARPLVWEAVARHLLCLVDCEEVRAAGESETVMLEWLRRKVHPH